MSSLFGTLTVHESMHILDESCCLLKYLTAQVMMIECTNKQLDECLDDVN